MRFVLARFLKFILIYLLVIYVFLFLFREFKSNLFVIIQALCVEMSRQQRRINVMNTLAEQFPFQTNSSLMIILDERLSAVNTLWQQLQKRAATRQNELETFVQQESYGAKNIPASDILSFRENFALLRSLYTPDVSDMLDGSEERDEDSLGVETLANGVEDDDNFVTQMELHELFEGVAGIEENLVSEEIVDGDMALLKQQLERIQVMHDLNNEIVVTTYLTPVAKHQPLKRGAKGNFKGFCRFITCSLNLVVHVSPAIPYVESGE